MAFAYIERSGTFSVNFEKQRKIDKWIIKWTLSRPKNHWKGDATLSDKEFFRQKEISRLQGAHIISWVLREGVYFFFDGMGDREAQLKARQFHLTNFCLNTSLSLLQKKNWELRVSIVKDLKMPYTRALRFCNFPRLGAETYPTHLDPIWKKLM